MSSAKPAREDGVALLSGARMRRACRGMLLALTTLALAAEVPAFQVPAAGLAAWPPEWHVVRDGERGVPAFVYGSHRPLVPASAVTDAALERAARGLVDELSRDLGYDAAGLQLVRVKHLALSRFGSSDKIAVQRSAVHDPVRSEARAPVSRGTADALSRRA